MNQKKAKGLRKQYRKEVEDFLKNGGLYELYELIVKPKPRWIPQWLWLLGAKVFINIQEEPENA
ncbi:hypothetical protein KAR91_32690 [Candidatus Pacearchaeota archaeon]|nr:hypothetical protein [Candidatus Pacearchaeota archaeon]